MKLQKIPKLLLFGLLALLLLSAVSVLGTQVKKVTPSNGSGSSSSVSYQAKLTVGQAAIGRSQSVSYIMKTGLWDIMGSTYLVAVDDSGFPGLRNQLFKNYPNPFNPSTRISFSLEEAAEVRLELYDLKGRKVDTLLQEVRSAGSHSITYQPQNLASGVYFVLMRADSFRATQRIMLVK